LRAKDHRRIDMALKLAHFPVMKDLASFDFAAQPSVDRRQMRDLAAERWNRRVAEWGTVFADALVATVILDRLLRHSHVVTIGSPHGSNAMALGSIAIALAPPRASSRPSRHVAVVASCVEAPQHNFNYYSSNSI
jgi:hypothetical protein